MPRELVGMDGVRGGGGRAEAELWWMIRCVGSSRVGWVG